jgi:hypothetical protein
MRRREPTYRCYHPLGGHGGPNPEAAAAVDFRSGARTPACWRALLDAALKPVIVVDLEFTWLPIIHVASHSVGCGR